MESIFSLVDWVHLLHKVSHQHKEGRVNISKKTLYENTPCIPTPTPTNISSVYHQNQGDIYVISIESFFLDGFLNVSAVITFGQPKPNSSSNWTQLDLSWAKVASKTADLNIT